MNDVITINGGSSSIKFSIYQLESDVSRQLLGEVERIGMPGTVLHAAGEDGSKFESRAMSATNHEQAANKLADWLQEHLGKSTVAAIGHRVVHGGIALREHQLVTDEMVAELKRTQPLDLAHLPREIALIEVFRRRFPGIPQVACFDTAFHRDLPRVAKLLPIPRQWDQAGIQRLGFHGLSYAYLMAELAKVSPAEANGRVILAHLGSGASMAAVHAGKPMDTTMAFTPTAGLVMGTRPGDIDPGLLVYLMRVQKMTPEEMDEFISHRCGMLGVSATTYDMRDLVQKRQSDERAAEAVDLFCYQAKKWIGALSAAMGGLDCLVFAGGIGEHSPEAREGICTGLDFLGLWLDATANTNGAAVISAADSRVPVRIIHTDEETMIARIVSSLLRSGPAATSGR